MLVDIVRNVKWNKVVKEIKKFGKTYYQCEICKFYYKDEKWAQKCEEFCKKYKSCSLEITKHAINPKNEK